MMMQSFLNKLPKQSFNKTSKFAFSNQIVGANGRRLPLPDNKPLMEFDPEMAQLLLSEQKRQFRGIELIASENFASRYTLQLQGSCLTNKYSEGYPGARYYGGNEFIDEIELLAQRRALEAYNLDENEWAVNVQAFSGCPANFAIYTALIPPGERLMGMSLTEGGHLSHGFYTPTRKVSATSAFWDSKQYGCNKETMLIDYEALAREALEYKPNLIVAGASAYPREIEYSRFRDVCDSVGAYLLADICHVSGLIAAGLQNRPFDHADVVMTTTHKSLQGPRASMIFSKKDDRNIPQKINDAVFPGL